MGGRLSTCRDVSSGELHLFGECVEDAYRQQGVGTRVEGRVHCCGHVHATVLDTDVGEADDAASFQNCAQIPPFCCGVQHAVGAVGTERIVVRSVHFIYTALQ